MNLQDRSWPGSFVGGSLCIDFVNTIEALSDSEFKDRLTDYEAVLRWSGARETVPVRAINKLAERARQDAKGASRAWRASLFLREELRALIAKLEEGREASAAIADINKRLAGLPPLPSLAFARETHSFVFDLPGRDLNEPVWPIIWSAAALLTSEHVSWLGRCHASPCRYMFVDFSRNKSRLWCSDACGNRERVRRHKTRLRSRRAVLTTQ